MPRHVGKRPISEDMHFAAMANTWNKETKKLIEIYGDGVMQVQLEGCKHNQEVYDKIAKDPIEAGYQRSGKQSRDKIKKLKGEYRNMQSQLGHLHGDTGFIRFFRSNDFDSGITRGRKHVATLSIRYRKQSVA